MFDQAIQASEALRETMGLKAGRLFPALKGCAACRTIQMIAAPVLGTCTGCGARLAVICYEEVSVTLTGPARDFD
jgi:hypothetical protein